jgi:riboflavin biosynthesis pyrimidine reductase
LTRQTGWVSKNGKKAQFQVFRPGRTSKTWLISSKWEGAEKLKGPKSPEKPQTAKALARQLVRVLKAQGYHEVLVEGGRSVWSPFLEAGLCDVLCVITAPVLLPTGERWDAELGHAWVKPLEFHRFTPLGPDVLTEFRRTLSAS